MEDKLTTAIRAYAEAQSKVLDRVFDNVQQTGSPSSADLACCLPDNIIDGLPEMDRFNAFVRKLRFLGYAMWKSSCYHQEREHAAFERERVRLIERFPELDYRFRESAREGASAAAPAIGADTASDEIAASVTVNGCTLFQLQRLPQGGGFDPRDESRRRHS